MGDEDNAYRCIEICLDLSRRFDEHLIAIVALCNLVNLMIRQLKWQDAKRHLADAENLALEIDAQGYLPEIYLYRALVHLAEERFSEAIRFAEASISLADELGMNLEKGIALRILGQTFYAQGDAHQALLSFEQSAADLTAGSKYERARTNMSMGMVLGYAGVQLIEDAGRLSTPWCAIRVGHRKTDIAGFSIHRGGQRCNLKRYAQFSFH